jgi:hypothetical protein
LEYSDAKLAAQRRLDEISLGLHVYLHEGDGFAGANQSPDFCAVLRTLAGHGEEQPDEHDGGESEMVEMSAVYMLASVRVSEHDYLDRDGVYVVPPGDAETLIGWGRARAATDAEIDAHNAEAERWKAEAESGPSHTPEFGWSAASAATP